MNTVGIWCIENKVVYFNGSNDIGQMVNGNEYLWRDDHRNGKRFVDL